MRVTSISLFFFFNDTATTEIYTLSLHDALPISPVGLRRAIVERIEREIEVQQKHGNGRLIFKMNALVDPEIIRVLYRSEEHTSELQSRLHLVCRLLLEKKKTQHKAPTINAQT